MEQRDVQQFWLNVSVGDPDSCWPWIGARDARAYGRFTVARRTTGAHRIAYTIKKGAIPQGLEIDHLCRNHSCVNPSHLEAVTHAENVRRGIPNTVVARKVILSMVQCKNGHDRTSINTKYDRKGHRICRICLAVREELRMRRRWPGHQHKPLEGACA